MRTGAIFARGSCRALKWLALFGVVFALGAAQAAAQATVTVTAAEKVDEGDRVMLTVGGTVALAADTTGAVSTETLSVEVTAAVRTPTASELAAGVTEGETADSAGFDPATLVISIPRAANAPAAPSHAVSGTVYWSVGSDTDAEDEALTLNVALTGSTNVTAGDNPAAKSVVIDDDETQTFVWSSTAPELKEGGTETVTLTASPTPEDRTYAATLAVDSLGYTVSPTTFSFDAAAGDPTQDGPIATITVTAPANDRNRVEDTITLEVTETGQVTRLADDLSIKVEDVHGLPETSDITAVAYDAMTGGNMVTSVEEGGVVYLEVVADRGTDGYPMGEAIEVALSLSDSSLAEFEEDKDKATVPTGTGETKAPRVKLTTKAMDSFPQTGTLVVSLEASGATATNGSETVSGTPLTLTITDATVRQVFVKDGAMEHIYGKRDAAKGSDGMLNPGDDFSVDNDMLFGSAEGYTFQVDAQSSMPAMVSVDDSGDVAIMPEAAGKAMITLTATARPETSSFRGTQVSESVAEIQFEVDVVATPAVAPGAPTSLEAAVADKQVTLTWMAPTTGDAPTGYQFRSTVDGRSSEWAATSSMTAHTVTGLTNGTEYTFEVRAMNAAGNGTAASVKATPKAPTPDPVAPGAPTSLEAAVADKQVTLTWMAPTTGDAPTGYQFRSTVDGRSSEWAATSSMTAHTVTGLTNGTEYTFEVRAMNAAGNGTAASVKATPKAPTPDPVAPGAPTSLEAAVADKQVTLTWMAPATGDAPTGYQFRSTVDGRSSEWAATSSMTAHTVTGLTNGTEYTFEVRAMNAAGNGTAASVKATPKAAAVAPGIVQDLEAEPGDAHVMLTWGAPSSGDAPTGYEFRSAVDARWSEWADTSSATGHTATGLTNGSEYTFEVRAMNAAGKGPAASVKATPVAPVPADLKGQVTEMKVIGGTEKTIGGTKRVHVTEGVTDVKLSMTVQWDHAELTALHAAGETHAEIWVYIRGAEGRDRIPPFAPLPNWVSWIDDNGDVDFPSDNSYLGNQAARMRIKLPAKPKANEFPDSIRHHKSGTGELRVLIKHDEHEAENDAFYISADSSSDVDLNAPDGVETTTPLIVIEDDEVQKVTIKKGTSSGPTKVYENAEDVTFTIAADPKRVDLPLDVRLDMQDLSGVTVSAAEISVSDVSLKLNAYGSGSDADNKADVTIHLPASDGNREDNDYKLVGTVNVYSLASGGFDAIKAAEHAITVLDIHKLPELEVSPMEGTVAEGGEIELTVTINRNPHNTIAVGSETRQYTHEAVDVMLTAGAGTTASMGDYRLPTTISFKEHNKKAPWTQEMKVKVMALEDDDLDDGEMLSLDAMVKGTVAANGSEGESHAGVSMLTIGESTGKLVWARTPAEVEAAVMAAKKAGMGDDMMFTAGEMIELEGNDLFGAAQGVSVGYSAMVEGDAVSESVSGGVVTITADSMGMAKVTITARAGRPSGAVTINDQTDPREASITIALEVGLVALSIELSGPEDMNLVEGGMGGMVTATANRAVTENVTVNLMRDRAMSSASDEDFTAEPITIMAGQTKGSTMVMAVEDNMMENDGNMAEELVFYGVAADNAGEVTGNVKFYLWDAAVPALPVIAQLLLAAFLAVGGYRRYLRR